jgi:hypothetical protein
MLIRFSLLALIASVGCTRAVLLDSHGSSAVTSAGALGDCCAQNSDCGAGLSCQISTHTGLPTFANASAGVCVPTSGNLAACANPIENGVILDTEPPTCTATPCSNQSVNCDGSNCTCTLDGVVIKTFAQGSVCGGTGTTAAISAPSVFTTLCGTDPNATTASQIVACTTKASALSSSGDCCGGATGASCATGLTCVQLNTSTTGVCANCTNGDCPSDSTLTTLVVCNASSHNADAGTANSPIGHGIDLGQ